MTIVWFKVHTCWQIVYRLPEDDFDRMDWAYSRREAIAKARQLMAIHLPADEDEFIALGLA